MKRLDIVRTARQYIGSPFQHQGRLKGIALDCVGLPFCVAEDLGILDRTGVPILRTDNANYSSQPLDSFVHAECQRRLIEKPLSKMSDGDIVTLRVPKVPCHVAMLSTVNGVRHMIHAYSGYATKRLPNGGCVEHVLDEKWFHRIEGVFEFPGVTNG